MRKTKIILLVFILVIIILNSVACSGNKQKKFDTPEDAIEYFVDAVARNDYDAILNNVFATEKADLFDFTRLSEKVQSMHLISYLAPTEYESNKSLNSALLEGQFANNLKIFTYSFFYVSDKTEDMFYMPIIIEDEDEIEDFIESVDPSKLKDLEIISIDEPEILSNKTAIKNLKDQAKTYGAEKRTERMVLYDLDGELYCGGISLLKYNDSWKIEFLSSPLINSNPAGAVGRITKSDYKELIKE